MGWRPTTLPGFVQATARLWTSSFATIIAANRSAGFWGHTSFVLLFLDLFYLPEEMRGAGLGSRIIALAEAEALQRGCTAAFVYTVTFQAPEFYERQGYREFARLTDFPRGHARIWLSKLLQRT